MASHNQPKKLMHDYSLKNLKIVVDKMPIAEYTLNFVIEL